MSVTHTIEDLGPLRKKATLTIPVATLAEYENEVLKDVGSQVRLPGFRPGRAPRHLIKRQYGKIINDELSSKAISESREYLEKQFPEGIYDIVTIDGADIISTTQDATLVITFDLKPTIILPEYKGLDVPLEPVVVSEEETQKALEDLRSSQSRYDLVERAAEAGDYVKVSYTGTIEGKPVKEIAPEAYLYGTQTSTWEEAGATNDVGIPAIVAGIVGKKAGDKATFTHTFPAGEDCPFEALRGKTASYDTEIFEVRAKILPELNEEFFKQMQAADLEDLKKQLHDRISSRKENEALAEQRKKAVELVVSQTADFPIPEIATEKIAQTLCLRAAMRSGKIGEDLRAFYKTIEAERKQFYPEAEKELKTTFILLEIAKKENLLVTRESLSAEISFSAYSLGEKDVAKYAKEAINDPEQLRSHIEHVLQEKAIVFVVENLKKTEE